MNRVKKRLLDYLKDVSGFEIKEVSIGEPAPTNLTPEILWNLWDIGLKFGQEIEKGFGFKLIFGDIGMVMEFYGYLENGAGGRDGFIVSKPSKNALSIIESPVFIDLKNGINLVWSKQLEASDILLCIDEVNRIATATGEMENGVRKERLFPISKTMLN